MHGVNDNICFHSSYFDKHLILWIESIHVCGSRGINWFLTHVDKTTEITVHLFSSN